MKNVTASYFMTDSLIHKVKVTLITTLFSFLPILPMMATPKIEVSSISSEGNMVTVKVKVLNQDNIPIENLNKDNFQVEISNLKTENINSNNLEFSPISKSNLTLVDPAKTKFQPADVVILLDMSGSMNQDDSSGKRKLDGAITSIKEFIKLVREENLDVRIAIIPFGEDGLLARTHCVYKVSQDTIADKLILATDIQLDQQLDQLARIIPCSATNLYDPLTEVVEFLGTPNHFYQPSNDDETNQEKTPPRLSVILLSDGYHNHNRATEEKQFEELKQVLKNHPQVTVHTLGYGEPITDLESRAKCKEKISYDDLKMPKGIDLLIEYCKLKTESTDSQETKPIEHYIVDEVRLTEIADLTGGISEFPNNANEAVTSLETFFNSLREYELEFDIPNAKPAERYEIVVKVISPKRNLNLQSAPQIMRLSNFDLNKLSFLERLTVLILTLFVLGITMAIFIRWSEKLKTEADSWLEENKNTGKTPLEAQNQEESINH